MNDKDVEGLKKKSLVHLECRTQKIENPYFQNSIYFSEGPNHFK